MHYIDLLLSFILFAIGILTLCLKSYKKNIFLISVCLLFFPIAIITYYFPEANITIFGNIPILDVVLYPLVKIVILLVILQYIFEMRKREGR